MTAAQRHYRVHVQRRDNSLGVTVARIRAAARAAAAYAGNPHTELSVIVVGDAVMRELNRTYAGVLGTTDVLAFDLSDGPASETSDEAVSGEVIVNASVAATEAAKRRRDAQDELLLYVTHGVLHLGGYRDHTAREKRAMRQAEAAVTAALGRRGGKGARL
jgi:probable rRNA maturation factor